ncbi:MAG: hypothetical protein ACRDST_02885 [Pseudonocardiaceae bacterium]
MAIGPAGQVNVDGAKRIQTVRCGVQEEADSSAGTSTARRGLDTALAAGVACSLGAVLYVRLTSSLAAAGRWDEAEAMAIEGLELDASATCAAALHAVRAEIALARGDLDGAPRGLVRRASPDRRTARRDAVDTDGGAATSRARAARQPDLRRASGRRRRVADSRKTR